MFSRTHTKSKDKNFSDDRSKLVWVCVYASILFFDIYVVVTGALIAESMVYRFGNSLKTTSIEDLLVSVKME